MILLTNYFDGTNFAKSKIILDPNLKFKKVFAVWEVKFLVF